VKVKRGHVGRGKAKQKAELKNLNWIVRVHPSEFKYMDQLLESGEERASLAEGGAIIG
jgi:hypothetical protein